MHDEILTLLPAELVFANEPMKKHTSFKIGGPAEVFVTPENTEQLAKIWKICQEKGYPMTVLGGGNNVLVCDEGIKGVVIVTEKMNKIEIHENKIVAGGGTKLHALADTAQKAGLSGLEFAHGIPGTVGGAIYMNAGAYNHEIKDICESVTVLLSTGDVITYDKQSLNFGYRKSRFQNEAAIITQARFRLDPKSPKEINAYMEELMEKRRNNQPLDKKSAGSTFKRPGIPNHYAAKMIDDCGLKGFTIGGAQVSTKHAGFVINTGNATANDVLALMEEVRERVHANTGIWLEPEVQMMGFC